MIKSEQHVAIMNKLQYPALIARSLDLILVRNDSERVQALRLTRYILIVAPQLFHTAIARSLMCVALSSKTPAELEEDKQRRDRKEDDEEEKVNDRMARAFIAVITELCILNQDIFLDCGGVRALMHSLQVVRPGRMTESILGALLHLLNLPSTRVRACVDLQFIAASFTDLPCVETKTAWAYCSEIRAWYHVALLSLMRSWPGVLHFCHPHDPLSLKSLVATLYLNNLNVRKAVLEVLHELLGLPTPEWTDEFSVILEAVDPARFQDEFKLSEGFVAKEGKTILPHISKCRVNISELHMSLVLYCLLEADILNALIYVIISEDTLISVSATILLGELMYLLHKQLPPECINFSPAVPNLVSYAVRSQQRALSAVTALSELHKMFRKRPAPASIFLDLVISHVEPRAPSQDADAIVKMKGKSLPKHKVPHILAKESEEAIKDSGVLTVKDAFAWNWEAIRAVFKTRAQPIVRLEESSHKMFLKKIVYFLLPSNNQLSRCDLYSSNNNNVYSLAAIDLLKFLLDCEHAEATRLLQEFLADLHDQLDCILTSESAHDTLLSPKNVSNTLCQHYFLFVGVLSNRNRGLQFLESSGVLEVLNRVALTSKHDCYVKLIVSSLDYSTSSATRLILSNILTCDQVSSRLYATQFLSILLRTKLELQPDYLNWVVESIVNQLQDEKKLVSLCALSALDEACDDKHYLEAVIALRPSLLYFGDKGLLLLIRFLSTTSGFTYLNEANFVSNQLERWATHFNYRYVQLMEADIHDSLTLHRRTEDGQYARRLSSARPPIGTAYVLPHLYGMLARHEAGFGVLRSHEHLYALFQRIIDGRCSTDEQILDLKAALWAAGNLATSPAGVRLLSEQGVLLPIVRLAEQCAVYSVRATGFYVLSMIATTRQGVALLHSMGWVSVRQNRHDLWPLVTCPLSSPPTTPEYMMEISASQQAAMGGHTSEESSESSDHVTPLFYMEDSGPGRSSLDTPLPWFRGKERASSERRSATLPHKSAMAPVPQHVRSYSESKAEMGSGVGDSWENTTDGQSHVTDELSDMRMSDVCKKSRSDSCCTDSSTSGVSSCDSSHAPRYHAIGSFFNRFYLLVWFTDSFSLRSKLMTQHSIGHSTFLSLRSLRPHPSPSVSIDLINFAEGNKMSPLVRPKLSAKYMHQPVSSEFEVTELPGLLLSDEEPAPTTPTVLAGAYPSSRSCIVGPAGQPTFGESETEDLWSGPCYQGICLPLHLPQMFPSLETIYSQENTHRLERGLDTEITSDQEAVDSDNEVEESKKPKFKHDRSCCLLCVVKYAPNRSQILRNRKISSSSIHRTRTETESSYGGGVGGEGESPILVPWPQQKTPALCETTPASGESSASHDNAFGFAKALMDSSSQSRSSVRKELLRLVELMANPILFRTCKQGLLTIKQSCKDLFQDVCVYSDVCNILAWCNHRLQARRFLQDLFVDSTFNELQEEPKSILTISPSCSLETDDLAHVATTSDRRDTASCDTDLDKAASTACELEVILESEGGGEASHRVDGEGQSRPADIVRPAKCDLNGCEGDGTLYSRGEKDSRVVDEGNGTKHSRLAQDSKAVDPHARLAQDSRVVQTPQSRLDNSRVFQTPRLENSGVGATSLADNCKSETYTRLGEDSNSRCDTSYSRLNQDAQNIEPSCTPQTEHVGDLPCKDQCPGGVPYKDPCPGSVPYKDHCPGGAYEDPCDEIWCPETKSDLILEKFESVYRSDSIDELSDEVLFLKPCSSRLVLSSPGEQSSADYRGTQPLSQRSLPLDQSGNVQPKSVSTSQLPSVPLDACLQTSLPTDPGCESVCQSGFSGTPTPQTGFSGNVPTTPQNHPTSLGLLDQTIASSRHCRARQYAEPLPSVSNESSALIPSDKNERYGVPVSNNSSVKETSSDGDGSSSFLVHRPGAGMDSGGSMNISTSQALNENISTSRELHENISSDKNERYGVPVSNNSST
ncbi:rapamycin-insensitive companion of mTOR-like [Diaphorina citri]|uniref:Rapamycin-insensitive companion of mTOR-like n=1 Tax=Diaphorina citri TaxID=121845 RepID=A0A3Q0JGR2_DIACI|nr:rapamycin-insensitive companion of mTOR-like [Diaphorina citri]